MDGGDQSMFFVRAERYRSSQVVSLLNASTSSCSSRNDFGELPNSSRCPTRCWLIWVKACKRLMKLSQRFFEYVGHHIASHPCIVIFLCLLISVALAAGFLNMKIEDRLEELYIPTESRAVMDLNRAQKHFKLKLKFEKFILMYANGSSALTKELFLVALGLHRNVSAISGFENICLRTPVNQTHEDCLSDGPLELFNFDEANMVDVNKTLAQAFINPSFVLRSGQLAQSLYPMYFADFKVIDTSPMVFKATALRTIYYAHFPEQLSSLQLSKDWELKYINFMQLQKQVLKQRGIVLLYTTGRSANDSVQEASAGDVKLIAISFLLTIAFCAASMTKLRNPVHGHFFASLFGIGCLALGIASAFGFIVLTGTPYVAFAGVLPFLILGVGIDNIFIITDRLDRLHPSIRGKARVKKALGQVGSSMTMATLTDLVAFIVSTGTAFPAIRYFCIYAALGLTFCFALIVTAFVAFLSLDVRRIEAGRRDCVAICTWSKADTSDPWTQKSKDISLKLMEAYGRILMKTPSKVATIILAVLLLAVGIYGTLNIDQTLNPLHLGKEGSSFVEFYGYNNAHYPNNMPVSVILEGRINYTDLAVQKEYAALSLISRENRYMTDGPSNWMATFLVWTAGINTSSDGDNFYPLLHKFLPQHPQFFGDIKFDRQGKIEVSKMTMYSVDTYNTLIMTEIMTTMRRDLREKSRLPVFCIFYEWIYFESYALVLKDTIHNLAICAGAILIITIPYLMHPVVSALVFFSFVSLILELLGMMYFTSVSLNSISMIIIVMAIGFSVDYSAHIAHAFITSPAETADLRAADALKSIGSSVFMGGLTTALGILVTGLASSEMFRIFFKMVFGIVTLGLLHGVLFLPVLLSVFCRTTLRAESLHDDDSQTNDKEVLFRADPVQ